MKQGSVPDNFPLFNAHTHKIVPNELSIFQCVTTENAESVSFFSIGIHPEQATADCDAFNALFTAASHPNCLAIGETGLDNRYSHATAQEHCFIAQLKLAHLVRKPVILHCVNEWDRCRKLHHTFAPETALIYHGFTKPSILRNVLSYPNAFISLGKRLLLSEPLQQAVKEVPLNRIFLETDNDDCELKEVYKKLAAIKSLPLATLTKQLYQNYSEVFHHGKLA